jgi:hypothetical protein
LHKKGQVVKHKVNRPVIKWVGGGEMISGEHEARAGRQSEVGHVNIGYMIYRERNRECVWASDLLPFIHFTCDGNTSKHEF